MKKYKYKISISDEFTTAEKKFVSKSGYYSISDLFAIISAETDLKRVIQKPLFDPTVLKSKMKKK
jgi:hypothetical protein